MKATQELQFVDGKAIVKQGRKVAAKVIDYVNFPRFGVSGVYALELNIGCGMWRSAQFATIQELTPHLQKHLGTDYSAI